MRYLFCIVTVILIGTSAWNQILKTRPAQGEENTNPTQPPKTESVIPLSIPAGTPFKVALDHELRVQKVGQVIHARTVEPIYSFDRLLVPVGSELIGKITSIERVPNRTRVLAAMDANFSPERKTQIEFSELMFPGGQSVRESAGGEGLRVPRHSRVLRCQINCVDLAFDPTGAFPQGSRVSPNMTDLNSS